jgi:transcriptional regulator with XRE-family HTH domain
MTRWDAYQDGAVVGGRIRQARRELGLTQAELATRIGVSLGVLDRFETGKGDPSGKLEQIAEITGRPLSWYTSTDQTDGGGGIYETGLPAELRRRLAESSGRHLSADAELVEEGDAADLSEASSLLPTEDSSARGDQPGLAESSEDLPEERNALAQQQELKAALAVDQEDAAALDEPSSQSALEDSSPRADTQPDFAAPSEALLEERRVLVQRQQELQAALAAEQQAHAARAAQMADELERVNANQQALAGMLDQSRSELATSRAQEARLAQRISQLETELRLAEERAADATDRLDRAETELERLRHDERARVEELDLREAELGVRSAELDTREAAVTDAKKDVSLRSTQLDAREAELRFRSAQLDTRGAQLGVRSAQVDTREAELGVRSAQLDTREAAVANDEAAVEDRRRALGDLELRAEAVQRREYAARLREDELGHREAVLDGQARRLDELKSTTEVIEGRRPGREDVHLAVVPDHGYQLVERPGPVPDPGAIVELDNARYRCLRIQASPFLGDDRSCAVLELLPPEPEPTHSTEPRVE